MRYALDNPGHHLRPGMFATATLKTSVTETPAFQSRLVMDRPALPAGNWRSLTVDEQKVCPVTDAGLGTMGAPVAVEVDKRTIWTCCDACPPKVKKNPAVYLAKLTRWAPAMSHDLTVAEQKICPVTGAKLGSMGDPILVEVNGRKVWTCCDACPPRLKAKPAKYLTRLAPPPRDQVLSVPESAVIDTGTRKIVYIESEPGVFEGREVVLGPRIGNRFPVLDGLSPGAKVAVSGAFLIDAESRINPSAVPPSDAVVPEKAGESHPTKPAPRAAAVPEAGAHRH